MKEAVDYDRDNFIGVIVTVGLKKKKRKLGYKERPRYFLFEVWVQFAMNRGDFDKTSAVSVTHFPLHTGNGTFSSFPFTMSSFIPSPAKH